MNDNVFYVNNADAAMGRAMEKARQTLSYFRESLQAPKAGQESLSVKAAIKDGEFTEHIWLQDVQMDEDGTFFGTVSNNPKDVTNIKAGSQIGIAESDLSDWMIVENGRLIGGYTIRAFRDQMSPAQREDFDVSLGLLIDDGVDHFPHDFSTPEGAILCLEDAMSRGDVEAAVQCKDFLREAAHLLGRIPQIEASPDIISETAKTLEVAFRGFFQDNAMPDFSEVERAFPQREYENDDTLVVTEICHHPDGQMTMDRIWTYRVEGEWKVGPPANEDL